MSLHRGRTAESRGINPQITTNDFPLPPVKNAYRSKHDKVGLNAAKTASDMSASSSGRRSDGSRDGNLKSSQAKPSALPRSTSSSSRARLSYIASTRPLPDFAGKSPPLQALAPGPLATSISKLDTPRANPILRSDQTYVARSLSPMDYDDDTVFGVAIPEKSSTYPPANLPPRLIPELQALAASNIRPTNPASSSIGSISSPSTVFTSSSSPWSASTNATTPLSWSSASPGAIAATAPASKRSHTVPTPANAREGSQKLAVLKERQPFASPNVASPAHTERTARKTAKTPRGSPEPTPPPRSSSLKSVRSRSNSAVTSRSERQDPGEMNVSQVPIPKMLPSTVVPPAPELSRKNLCIEEKPSAQGHSRLQEAPKSAPRQVEPIAAPSTRSDWSRVAPIESPRPRQLLEPLPTTQSHHRRFPSLSRRHARQPSTSEPEVEKQSARSRLAKFSRLALFGKSKSKGETTAKLQKSDSRKGPAAGTGHEGYGKFGRRTRKQSIGSSNGSTDSEASTVSVLHRPTTKRDSRISSSSQDQSDLDDFASSRSKPVVMLGGSQRGRTNPFPPMPKAPQLSDVSLNTMSSAETYPAYTHHASPRRERFPSKYEDRTPSLATRRSQRFVESEDSFRMPEPIDTRGLTATPALDSRNTTQSSSELPTPASAMYRVNPGMMEKQTKGRRLKWNIFRRKDSISESEDLPDTRPPARLGMTVNVAPGPAPRHVPYYAMLGSEHEITPIGEYLREAQESPEREDEIISVGFSDDEVLDDPYTNRDSVLLPSAPSRQVAPPLPALKHTPQVYLRPPKEQQVMLEPTQRPAPARKQPRLAQVGRIPKVIPTRQQAQSGVSASSEVLTAPATHVRSLRPKASRDQLPRLATRQFLATQPASLQDSTKEPEQPRQRPTEVPRDETEFLRFSETRNSDFTTSSESTGIISILGPPFSQGLSYENRPVSHLSHEDDVWNEYNDFMDDIMSPSQSGKSPLRSRKTERTIRIAGRQVDEPTPSESASGLAVFPTPVFAVGSSRRSLEASLPPPSFVPPLQEMASSEEIRLRRSRIAAALHASYAPSSPFSVGDFIDEYGRPSSGRYSERLSGSSAPGATPTQAFLQPERAQSQPRQYENAAQLEDIERTKNPTKHSDRQYASLMVSRWLSFGRVLFSPAQNEIESNPQRHVLVIDGLGSEDWSIYCAVTYQAEQAFVHDLKERRRGQGKSKASLTSEGAPPNHRRSEVSNFNEKFPFPPAFFSAIVVRFPPAMPDAKLKNIISECRRVLAPGGYLELMVLDLDIVNMGVQTRRAIKELKIKMTAADRTISLKPIIDNVQTVLGSNGFSNLNRCVVGVPVIGKPVGSHDSSSESRSSSGSMPRHRRRSSAGPRPYGNLAGAANFSLNDLVADHSDNADAKIGRMVSRTARSWWQHCFEAGIMTDSNKSRSVFANKEVLSECKTRAASFKLLIAYTQKPPIQNVEHKRRTMSEPTVPTLATSGISRPPR